MPGEEFSSTKTRSIAEHAAYIAGGIQQAFRWSTVISLLSITPAIQKAMLKTFLLNGVIYLGGLFVIEEFYSTPTHTIFGYSYASLTGYPMYLLCLIVNARYFGQIAQHAFQTHTDRQYTNMSEPSVNTPVTIALTTAFYCSCAAFSWLLRWIPLIGPTVSYLTSAVMMAYYCFEYKWVYLGWSLEQRILYVEQHWSFFLGFGIPAATLTFFLSTLRAGAVFALIYPSFVILATVASLKPASTMVEDLHCLSQWSLPARIPVFFAVRKSVLSVAVVLESIGTRSDAHHSIHGKKDHLGKLV